jgi:hypothetical protein
VGKETIVPHRALFSSLCPYCERVVYENLDGRCVHSACEGDLSDDCGVILAGTPTDAEQCLAELDVRKARPAAGGQ